MPKKDNELRATQTLCLKLDNVPNEFKGHLRNRLLAWDMPQQQDPLGWWLEMCTEITFMEM